MLNLIKAQNELKNLSDEQLPSVMQSGSVPPFLVLAEMNRRQEMRAAAGGQDDGSTVLGDVMKNKAPAKDQGLGSIPMGDNPMGMPPAPPAGGQGIMGMMPQQPPMPQQFAGGGGVDGYHAYQQAIGRMAAQEDRNRLRHDLAGLRAIQDLKPLPEMGMQKSRMSGMR